jgi:hypothetical protein
MADWAIHQRMDSERIFPASAVPTFCDEIPHKLFSASWQIPKFPMLPIVGTALE